MGPEVRASDEKETLIPASYDEFRNWLIGYVDDVWGIPDSLDLNGNIDFESLGMDSLEAHMMASLIEDQENITCLTISQCFSSSGLFDFIRHFVLSSLAVRICNADQLEVVNPG